MKEHQLGKEDRGWQSNSIILNGVVSEGLSDKVVFEQKT